MISLAISLKRRGSNVFSSVFFHHASTIDTDTQDGKIGVLNIGDGDKFAAGVTLFIYPEELEQFITELSSALKFLESLLPSPPEPELQEIEPIQHTEPFSTCPNPTCKHNRAIAAAYGW